MDRLHRQTASCLFLVSCTVWAHAAAPVARDGPAPPIRIVYFVTSDRAPIAGFQERLDRVMTEVQRFYRQGMQTAGYGPKTFGLDRDEQGRLRMDVVSGKHPMRSYGRNDAGRVREEVKTALAARGIDVDRQTIVIFQTLLAWEGGRAIEIGPYVGGGDQRAGTAWVYDDERLDARLLGSREPGGYYGRPCSVGEFNSHYIGGVAHELGHAFGLPHDCQRVADRARGLSLMGGGNHTYGQELRGEGPGSFLTAASAMLLAYSRPFAGEQAAPPRRPSGCLCELDARFAGGKIVLTGEVIAEPPAFGIAAFNDWAEIPADYDAVSWTCPVADDGSFRLEVGELRAGASQLRLRVCRTDGTSSQYAFDYRVDAQGTPDLTSFLSRLPLAEAVGAYAAGDRRRAAALAAELQRRFADTPDVRRKAAHLETLLKPWPPRGLAELPDQAGPVSVSDVRFRTATVGWGRPLFDEVLIEPPDQCFLQVGGQFFERGLYAHAPARHELVLDRKWRRFQTSYGLQDGHDGSVVFVVQDDGRELFRSPTIREHVLPSDSRFSNGAFESVLWVLSGSGAGDGRKPIECSCAMVAGRAACSLFRTGVGPSRAGVGPRRVAAHAETGALGRGPAGAGGSAR